MKKAVFIIPYFGTFPRYFSLFLNSCAKNEDFVWFFFTDDTKFKNELPSNVKFFSMKISEFVLLVEEKLGIKIKYKFKPYKLCDFKPAYGFLFSEFIREYPYWGHCDVDLIFGNLNNFLDFDKLKEYDKLFVNGHFSLYKNTEDVNNFFRLEAPMFLSFEEAIRIKNVVYFDEIDFVNILNYHRKKIFTGCSYFLDILPQYANFRPLQFRSDSSSKLFLWQNGSLKVYRFDSSSWQEFMYIHLQKRDLPIHGLAKDLSEAFLITPSGFYPWRPILINDVDLARRIYKGSIKQVLRFQFARFRNLSLDSFRRMFLKLLFPQFYFDPCRRELSNNKGKRVNRN